MQLKIFTKKNSSTGTFFLLGIYLGTIIILTLFILLGYLLSLFKNSNDNV